MPSPKAGATTIAAWTGVFVALCAALAQPAHADEPRRRRPVPDYDSREERGTDAEDVLLWIPRIVTGPLYLVSEYVLRVPLGAVMTELERHDVITDVADFVTFGPDDKIMILPTAFWDFGFAPSIGAYAQWFDVISPGDR